MTLNLVLASKIAVHVGADFRLTNADTGGIVSERSPKILVLREHSWEAVVTYCGVGRWKARATSDWLKLWLVHNQEENPSFGDTANKIEHEGSSWLAEMRVAGAYTGPHSFILAGLVGGVSKIALISNYDRLQGAARGVSDPLSTEITSPRKRIIVCGATHAVSRAHRKSLLARLSNDDDVSQIQRHMGRIINLAASSPASRKTISSSNFCYSLLSTGQGQGYLHGNVQGSLEIVSIVNGSDPFALIRAQLGKNIQLIPTAHAQIDSKNPIKVEHCSRELDDPFDGEGVISGFKMVELLSLGSGYASASCINSRGLVVGQSNSVPDGPGRACFWQNDGIPHEIGVNSILSWAVGVNDSGQMAGTLKLADGSSRAFLVTSEGRVMVSETLGGLHCNAHGLNAHGEVVGGSWSLPGNTPGDKRERAFKWVEFAGLQDLGALREDCCVPIRLTQTPTTCRVRPSAGI